MKKLLINPVAQGITRRAGLLTLLGSAMALAGCGGGGDGGGGLAGVGAGGTGSFSVGPITGFGSIIVNGVRFDDTGASVRDDDGGLRNRSELKLGMLVTVIGSTVTRSTVTGDRATATSIVFGGELQGPISAKSAPNVSPQTLTVLGQTVQITGSTIFDVSLNGGFAALLVNDIVEVHGLVNQVTNTIQATFIEKKNNATVFKLQGLASNHDDAAKKFNIGVIRINYSTTTDVRVIPTNGTLVRVRLTAAALPGPAEWTATRIRPPENANEDRDEAEIEGSVTAFTSAAQFSVNGIAVTTSTSTAFPDGTALALGMRVEVKGRLSAGVLIAERVKIEDSNDVNGHEFELHGTVSGLVGTTFVLRGVTVDFSGSPEFRDGTSANLVNGANVEVKGVVSTDGTKVRATRIKFE